MAKENKNFNIVINGVGGQGLITMLQVIAVAAMDKGYSVKTSELHGLSQRGGSVSVHIRFGEKVYSPIIPKHQCDLVIALEMQESLNAISFSSKKTAFLVNKYQSPTLGQGISESYIRNTLNGINKKTVFLDADKITEKALGANVVSGIFFLGYAAAKGLISLTENDIKKSIKKVMPERYWALNIKAIDLAKKYAQKE